MTDVKPSFMLTHNRAVRRAILFVPQTHLSMLTTQPNSLLVSHDGTPVVLSNILDFGDIYLVLTDESHLLNLVRFFVTANHQNKDAYRWEEKVHVAVLHRGSPTSRHLYTCSTFQQLWQSLDAEAIQTLCNGELVTMSRDIPEGADIVITTLDPNDFDE